MSAKINMLVITHLFPSIPALTRLRRRWSVPESFARRGRARPCRGSTTPASITLSAWASSNVLGWRSTVDARTARSAEQSLTVGMHERARTERSRRGTCVDARLIFLIRVVDSLGSYFRSAQAITVIFEDPLCRTEGLVAGSPHPPESRV
jgi:hypothetical protein